MSCCFKWVKCYIPAGATLLKHLSIACSVFKFFFIINAYNWNIIIILNCEQTFRKDYTVPFCLYYSWHTSVLICKKTIKTVILKILIKYLIGINEKCCICQTSFFNFIFVLVGIMISILIQGFLKQLISEININSSYSVSTYWDNIPDIVTHCRYKGK